MPPLAVSLGYILLIALWGWTWAAIKIGVDAVPPFVFAFERAVAVSAILIGLSLALRLPFPRDRRVILAALAVGTTASAGGDRHMRRIAFPAPVRRRTGGRDSAVGPQRRAFGYLVVFGSCTGFVRGCGSRADCGRRR